MPRILPPPTRYDPLRLVQAKPAAGPKAVAIPPTRFAPPIQHRVAAGTIQRAAAKGSGVAGGGGPPPAKGAATVSVAADNAKSNAEDTLAMKYVRAKMDKKKQIACMRSPTAIIGRDDKVGTSEIEQHISKSDANCLAVYLVCRGDNYSKGKNVDWLDTCYIYKQNVIVLNNAAVSLIRCGDFRNTDREKMLVLKQIGTSDEVDYLVAIKGYQWDGKVLVHPANKK